MSQSIDLEAQIQCVKRELGFRARAYPRFVKEGRMTAAKKDYEIAAMTAVLATLQRMLPPPPQQELISGG